MDPLAAQQYCLRWNNHQNNLLTVFEDLLNNEAFVDVTLACDGMQLKAHKMVLSACSPYFQSLLFSTPDRHPIVFLKDVKFVEMKALLEFMYRGEVSVDQDRLSSLLKVAENLRIKGLAEVSCDQRAPKFPVAEDFSPQIAQNANLPNLPLAPLAPLSVHSSQHFGMHPFGLINAHSIESVVGNSLVSRLTSSTSPPPPSGHTYLGPKRKRGRPRRLSGSEAVPMASGTPENGTPQISNQPEDMRMKTEQGATNESRLVSPGERVSTAEASSDSQSNDRQVAGSKSPKKEPPQIWSPSDFTKPLKGKPDDVSDGSSAIKSLLNAVPEGQMKVLDNRPREQECYRKMNNDKLKARDDHMHIKSEPMELTIHTKMDNSMSLEDRPRDHFDKSGMEDRHCPPKKSHQSDGQRRLRRENLHNIFKPKDHEDRAQQQGGSEPSLPLRPMSSTRGMRVRGRGGRRGRHRGDRMGSRSMSEMSVRGLDLLRYAIVSPDGTFRCIECDRVQVSKHFKNKYSFQRHAFLYHEGAARKVFPCLVCHKEFSRPDKMKQHMKMSHEATSPSKVAPAPSPNSMAAALSAAFGSTSAAALLVNSLQATTNEVVNQGGEGKFLNIKDPSTLC